MREEVLASWLEFHSTAVESAQNRFSFDIRIHRRQFSFSIEQPISAWNVQAHVYWTVSKTFGGCLGSGDLPEVGSLGPCGPDGRYRQIANSHMVTSYC
jgi:hypothetical protein